MMRRIRHAFRHHPGRIFGLVMLVLFAFVAIFGPMFYPSPLPQNANLIYAPPSWAHPLGTDYGGTDVLAEIITGARFLLYVAALSAVFQMVVGVLLGLVSGYTGGALDQVLMRLADLFLTIPGFPLLVVISTIINMENPLVLAAVLALTSWAGLARSIRSQVLTQRERDYVEAARGFRMSIWHILWREILPSMGPYVAINMMFSITGAIYQEVGLFFLGLVPFAYNNWGVMLNIAYTQAGAMYTTRSLLYLLSPLFCILLLNYAIILTTGAVDEVLNPRLSGG
jgi:peptide/nickel transport system permease protein